MLTPDNTNHKTPEERDLTHAAILNVLEDYQENAASSNRQSRAILNILEDLETSNRVLESKTAQMAEAAEALLQKNAIDTAILESIGDGIIVTDSLGRITFVNRAFVQMTGWNAAEVAGGDIQGVLPIENANGVREDFLPDVIEAVLSGTHYTSDTSKPYFYVRKDGTKFPASSIITPVRLHGQVVGLVTSFRNITREMDIDKAKTEFVSLASHQLRSPLSAINWYTEMLLAGDVGPITEGQEKYLCEVYKGNQRMITLVNALLNVTRMSLGTFILEPEPIEIIPLLQNVVAEQQPDIEKKNLHVRTRVNLPISTIESDTKLLRMVLQNLVSNAIKYTPPGGNIDLALELDPSNQYLRFTVTDTGCGIPLKQHPHIFTRLFRADNVRTQDIEGTGLGLYIVKAIIENSGGRVWFESEENIGSIFHVELPLSSTVIT